MSGRSRKGCYRQHSHFLWNKRLASLGRRNRPHLRRLALIDDHGPTFLIECFLLLFKAFFRFSQNMVVIRDNLSFAKKAKEKLPLPCRVRVYSYPATTSFYNGTSVKVKWCECIFIYSICFARLDLRMWNSHSLHLRDYFPSWNPMYYIMLIWNINANFKLLAHLRRRS